MEDRMNRLDNLAQYMVVGSVEYRVGDWSEYRVAD